MKRDYELVLILDPELKAEEQEKLLKKVEKSISDAEGEFSKPKELGKKDLAYPLKKRRTGVFYLLGVSLPAQKTTAFKQKCNLEEGILRFLMTKKEE